MLSLVIIQLSSLCLSLSFYVVIASIPKHYWPDCQLDKFILSMVNYTKYRDVFIASDREDSSHHYKYVIKALAKHDSFHLQIKHPSRILNHHHIHGNKFYTSYGTLIIFDVEHQAEFIMRQLVKKTATSENLLILIVQSISDSSKYFNSLEITPVAKILRAKINYEERNNSKIYLAYATHNFHNNRTKVWRLGDWSLSRGLKLKFSFERCCYNLSGLVLKVVTIQNGSVLINKIISDKRIVITEFFGGILYSLLSLLDLSADIYYTPDDKYGNLDDNGLFNGMIGQVQSQMAQIAVADISMTAERAEVVEFSPAITFTSHTGIYQEIEPYNRFLYFYLSPFTILTWWLVAGSATLVILTILVYDHTKKNSSKIGIMILVTAITGQGFNFSMRSPGRGILYFSLLLFGMLLNTFYSSKLTSNHIVEWQLPPFTNLMELSHSNTYYPVIPKNTSLETTFMSSKDQEYISIKKIIVKDKNKYLIPNPRESAKDIRRDGEVYIESRLSCEYFRKQDPRLKILDQNFMWGGLHFVWQKNLSIGPILSKTLMKMKEVGTIDKFYRKYFSTNVIADGVEKSPHQFQLIEVSAPFVFLVIVICISGVHHLITIFLQLDIFLFE